LDRKKCGIGDNAMKENDRQGAIHTGKRTFKYKSANQLWPTWQAVCVVLAIRARGRSRHHYTAAA